MSEQSEITLAEIIKLKTETEDIIKNAINSFTERTGLPIERLVITPIRAGMPERTKAYHVDIEAKI